MIKKYYKPTTLDADKIIIALKKATRNYDIASRACKGESYASIGKDHNMTRQRVEQILKRLSLNG